MEIIVLKVTWFECLERRLVCLRKLEHTQNICSEDCPLHAEMSLWVLEQMSRRFRGNDATTRVEPIRRAGDAVGSRDHDANQRMNSVISNRLMRGSLANQSIAFSREVDCFFRGCSSTDPSAFGLRLCLSFIC